jgi:hypothetical protein
MTIQLLTTGIALFLICVTSAQRFEVSTLPSVNKEFIKPAPCIITANKWLESTPVSTYTLTLNIPIYEIQKRNR